VSEQQQQCRSDDVCSNGAGAGERRQDCSGPAAGCHMCVTVRHTSGAGMPGRCVTVKEHRVKCVSHTVCVTHSVCGGGAWLGLNPVQGMSRSVLLSVRCFCVAGVEQCEKQCKRQELCSKV
jgi:hypothetical protein